MRKLCGSRISLFLVAALVGVAVVGAPVAYAQTDDPSSAQYNPPIPDEGTGGSSASGGLDNNIGSLPFTGMDLLIVGGVALVLTGTGFALRRLSAPPRPRV